MRLKNKGIRVLGVDFNPIAVRRWRSLGLNTEYGDATDLEFVSTLPLSTAKWVVSTIPIHPTGVSYEDTRRTLMQAARSSGFRGRIAVTSHSEVDTKEQSALGADIVLEPFHESEADDLLIVQLNPPRRTDLPAGPEAIADWVNELAFNASLVNELRDIPALKRALSALPVKGRLREPLLDRLSRLRLHRIAADEGDYSPGARGKFTQNGRISSDCIAGGERPPAPGCRTTGAHLAATARSAATNAMG
ncbi:MAG: NAD-binding protein [Burkholderiaceae bacterium]|nr:NAD-binding protein [Burkholderiaceae bacterium]